MQEINRPSIALVIGVVIYAILALSFSQSSSAQSVPLRINDSIFRAAGFGNTFMVTTPEGNVIIDTSVASNAAEHREMLRSVNDGPVKYIILTHAHFDHIGGISLWREPDTEIIAQNEHVEFVNYQFRLREMFRRRNAAQFPDYVSDVVLDHSDPLGSSNYGATIQPTILFDEEYRFELGGIEFVLMHTPGETYDHLSVWIPQFEAVFVGDNFYRSFPNMYTLRGTKPRWALDYVSSLDRIIELEPEILIPSHGDPIYDYANIEEEVTNYRDAILSVHDQTVAGMNEGKDMYTLMQEVKLPPNLGVSEGYGAISWSVRGIYEGYIGWFDGNPSTLYPIPRDDVYIDLVNLSGGVGAVSNLAQTYLNNGQLELALHATDIALQAVPADSSALQVRLDTLLQLLDRTNNSNEIHWLELAISQTETKLSDQ